MDRRQHIAIREFVSDRTPRPLMGPLLTFDLAKEARALRDEPAWIQHRHNARTLLKHSEFRLVLIALASGARIAGSETDERVAIQVLRGRLRVEVPTEVVELGDHGLLALDRHLEFSIEAQQDSELLLWLGWSDPDRGA